MNRLVRHLLSGHLPQRALEGWISLLLRRPGRVVALSVAAAAAALLLTAARLEFKSDRSDLVDPTSAQYQNWKRYRDEFGGESDLVVVIEGSDRARMTSALETVARDLEGFPDHFEKIFYRVRTEPLRVKGLFQLSLEDLHGVQSRIGMLRPLLAGGWDFLSLENVLTATAFRLQSLSSASAVEPTAEQGLSSTAAMLESLAFYLDDGRVYQSPWGNLRSEQYGVRSRPNSEYFFSSNGKLAFLRVLPVANSATGATPAKAVNLLRQLLDRVRVAYPDLRIGLTGLPALESDEMASAARASLDSVWVSTIGVLFVFVCAFRVVRCPLFATVSMVLAGCWAIGWVTLTVGHLTILSAAFFVTLIGLGSNYGILWVSRWESDRTSGLDLLAANLETANSIGRATIVDAVTTALAFFATMFTGFLGLQEMGWIAGCGVLFCLLGTVTVLPAMLVLWGGKRPAKRLGNADNRPAFAILARRPAAVIAGVALVTLVVGANARRLRCDYNLLNLQQSGLPSVEWEKRLLAETGTSAWYALSIADSVEEARQLKTGFEALPTVGRIVEIASLVPADQADKQPIIREIHDSLAHLPENGQKSIRTIPRAASIADRLGELTETQVRPPATLQAAVERLHAAARSARQALDRLTPVEQSRRLVQYEDHWTGDLLTQLRTLRSVSNPEPVGVSDLPPPLVERHLSPGGKWLLQIFARSGVWDMEPLQEFCKEVCSVDPQVTGKPISTLHALSQMHDGFVRSAWLAGAVVMIAVWFDFRNMLYAVLSAVPLVLGSLVMFGAMGIFGIPVNPANLVVLPLVFGIGVDAGVHVLHDFRQSTGPYVLPWRLARSLLLCALTNAIGFAALMVARHHGIFSIGVVLTIGVTACTAVSLTLLPAALHYLSRRRPEPATIPIRELPSTVARAA